MTANSQRLWLRKQTEMGLFGISMILRITLSLKESQSSLILWSHELTLAPPPSSGGTTIATILNIVSNYDYKNMPRDTFAHLLIEAMRRAYKDRSEYLGDPDFVDVPVDMLISKNHASNHLATIDLDKASPSMKKL